MQTCKKILFTILLLVISLEYSNLSPLLVNYIAMLSKNKNYCGCSTAICCCEKNSLENLCTVFSKSSKVPHSNNSTTPKTGQEFLNCAGLIKIFSVTEFKNVLVTYLPQLITPLFIRNEQFASPGILKSLSVKNRIFRPPKTSSLENLFTSNSMNLK